MNKENNIEKYLPLSESTYYIMLMLVEPRHGYGIMQNVEEITRGAVIIGPGTLYGALSTLENEKLIVMVHEEARRKLYTLTDKGRSVLERQVDRLELMSKNARRVLS